MSILASTGEDGKAIELNASNLVADIDATQTSFTVATRAFSNGDEIVIDQEHILIGTVANGSGTTQDLSGCTRDYNSSGGVLHYSGANVLLNNGTELISKTFNGSEYFSLALVGAEGDFRVAFMWSGTKRFSRITLQNPYIFYPKVRYKPTAGTVFKILAWVWSDRLNLSAEISS